MDKFQIISQFYGYRNKTDVTNLPLGVLVTGSQNVVSNDGDRIAARQGYALDGLAASGTAYPIIASYEWKNNRGIEHALRRYNDTLEVRYQNSWYVLKTGLTTTGVNKVTSQFTEFWDNTNKIDTLLFTDGSANIYSWTGGLGIFASATATTITLASGTWAEAGFSATGTIIVNGVSATYTGGYATNTLTGVTIDFSATPVGTPVFEGVLTNAVSTFTSTNVSLPSDFKVDLIIVLNNQVAIGSLTSREVYLSKVNSFSNYSKSSPRVTGEGEKFTLDASAIGFAIGDYKDDQNLNICAGDFWYVMLFTPSADQTRESVQIKRLKTQPQKGAKSQAFIGQVVNDIMFISNEPTFDSLGRVENIVNPQTKPLSDSIKIDFDTYSFDTDGDIKYFKNFIYVAIPGEGLLLMYNVAKGWWEAPQTIPVRRLAVIDGELYGHSSQNQETYKLFTGYNDNGAPIRAIAAFSYDNGGDRTLLKDFTEYFTEGYMTSNTVLTQTLNYEYKGFAQQLQRDIQGTNEDIIFETTDDYSLGTHSLGEVSLGGGGGDLSLLPPKFRIITTFPAEDYFEYQVIYSSNDLDQQWELLALGPAATVSTIQATSIKD